VHSLIIEHADIRFIRSTHNSMED